MSHFTTIKTQMANKRLLQQALQDLGYRCEEGRAEVRGYEGHRTPVDLKILLPGSDYDIGFRRAGETYECVADWDALLGFDRKIFVEKIMQRYAYHTARAKLEEQGFTLASEETQKDGRIHLVLRRAT
ncbi:MAG: DUF1257 domain-containing protein [Verrucomicrobiota bacterium]